MKQFYLITHQNRYSRRTVVENSKMSKRMIEKPKLYAATEVLSWLANLAYDDSGSSGSESEDSEFDVVTNMQDYEEIENEDEDDSK